MGTSGSTTPHQLSRVEGSFPSLSVLSENQEWNNCSFQVNNHIAIAYANKMGGPAMIQLCSLALWIWQWCLVQQITPHAEYLAGKENVIADWESRHHDNSNW